MAVKWSWRTGDYEDYDDLKADQDAPVPVTPEELDWVNLLRDSKGNPGLTVLVEQCKMYHILGKE